MTLPNVESAVVSEDNHRLPAFCNTPGRPPQGGVLPRLRLAADAWQTLAAALQKHAADHEVAKVENTPFGTRYVVEGTIETPYGRTPSIRSVWFLETGQDVPRFVTAYPIRGADDDD